jgi:ribosome-binding factor A
MTHSAITNIKRAQKEALLLREISQLFMQAALDEPRLQNITINRVSLSQDKSACTVYFYTSAGQQFFETVLPILILYKPSLRKALAKKINARYTPDLIFAFDENFDKHMRLESILEKVKQEDAGHSTDE